MCFRHGLRKGLSLDHLCFELYSRYYRMHVELGLNLFRQTEVGLVGQDQRLAAVPEAAATERARTARHRQCHPEGRVL